MSIRVSLLAVGLCMMLVSVGMCRGVALSICSKLVPPETVNRIMTWATIFMSLGRGGTTAAY